MNLHCKNSLQFCLVWNENTKNYTIYCSTHYLKYIFKIYKCNIEALSCNHCCCGKAVSIIYSEDVSVLLQIQHAKHMQCITLSSVACLALPYFSILFHK